jgi:hypothetical protein
MYIRFEIPGCNIDPTFLCPDEVGISRGFNQRTYQDWNKWIWYRYSHAYTFFQKFGGRDISEYYLGLLHERNIRPN